MYKKGEKLDISKWILVKMYQYRSLIPFENQIDSYDDSITKQENGNFYIKELYDHFLHIAGVYSLMLDENDTKIVKPLSFMLADTIVADNKCVFEILNIETVGGCSGNLKGIGSLVVGMDINEVIKRLEGLPCGNRPTSCPDQLAKAIKLYLNK